MKTTLLTFLLLWYTTFAFAQPTFTLDKIYFKDQYINKVSVSFSGEAYVIKGENSREVAFTNDLGEEKELTQLFTPFTDKAFNDIQSTDSNYVFVATNGDYLLRYKGNTVKHLKQEHGLQDGLITSLAGRYVLYMGTRIGLFNSQNRGFSRFAPTYLLNNPTIGMMNTQRADIFSVDRGINFQYKHPPIWHYCYDKATYTQFSVYANFSYRAYTLRAGVPDTSHVYSALHIVPFKWGQYDSSEKYQYLGTSSGLKKSVENGCGANIYLPKRKVFKVHELRTYPNEIYEKGEIEKRYLLSATDSGLYINKIQVSSRLRDTLELVPGTAHLKIFDIDTDACYSKVWLATDQGLYTLNIDHKVQTLAFNLTPSGLQSVCFNPSYRITAPVQKGFLFQWQKDGDDIPGATLPYYDATEPGTYRVMLTESCYGQTTYTDTITLIHDQLLEAPLIVKGNLVKCAKDVVELSTTASNNYQYQWYKDDSPLSGSVAKVYNYKTTIDGAYKVKITNCYGTSVLSETIQIRNNQVPVPIVTTTASKICYGQSAEFTVQPYEGKIEWLNNGVTLPSEPGLPTKLILQAGDQSSVNSIQAKFTNEFGCSTLSEYKIISVNSPPSVTITRQFSEPLCPNAKQRLTASTNIYDYAIKWSTGSNATYIDVDKPGTYSVSITNRSTGCISTASAYVNFYEELILDIPSDTLICEAKLTSLAIPAGSLTHTYKLDGRALPDNIVRINKAGTYTVEAKNAGGCTITKTLTVTNFCDNFIIPNIITPNGDNLNDYFVVLNLVPNCNLKVLNRNGNIVYQTANYQNNWQGDNLPDGAYYFILNSASLNRSWKGWIEILH